MPSAAVLDFWLNGWDTVPSTSQTVAPTPAVLRLSMPAPTVGVSITVTPTTCGWVGIDRHLGVEPMVLRLAMPSPTLRIVAEPPPAPPRPRPAPRRRTPQPQPAPVVPEPEPTPVVRSAVITAEPCRVGLSMLAPTLTVDPPAARQREEEDVLFLLDLL